MTETQKETERQRESTDTVNGPAAGIEGDLKPDPTDSQHEH